MGMLFLVLGLLTILMAAYRFLTVQNQLREQKYRPSSHHVLLFLMAFILLGGTLILHVLQLNQALG